MTEHDFTQFKYWFDLAIKALVGVVISIVGMDYRSVKTSLSELEQAKHHLTMEVQIVRTELFGIKDRLSRIESKIDRLADK